MPRNSVWVEEKDCVKEIVVITDDVGEIDHGRMAFVLWHCQGWISSSTM
jgi:hypothetical protein